MSPSFLNVAEPLNLFQGPTASLSRRRLSFPRGQRAVVRVRTSADERSKIGVPINPPSGVAMAHLNSSLEAWHAVEAHAREIKGAHLRDLWGGDAQRWKNLHLEHGEWLLDFSRQRITQKSLALLLRSRAGGGFAGAHRRHVSRRSDQYHRATGGAAHRPALGVCGFRGDPSGSEAIRGTSSRASSAPYARARSAG